MDKLKVGAGIGTIHFPAEMFPIEGFCGTHDDPHARILLLESGKRTAIVSLELVMLPDTQIQQVQKLVGEYCGVQPEDVFVHLTHAITTPHDPRMMPPHMRPDNAEAVGRLHEAAVHSAVKAAAVQAVESITEVSTAFAKGESAVNINRDVETPFGWWIGAGEADRPIGICGCSNFPAATGNPPRCWSVTHLRRVRWTTPRWEKTNA